MSLLLHVLIVVCLTALLPSEPTINDWALYALTQLLVLVAIVQNYKEGILKGKAIVWEKLAETFHEKGIESVSIIRKNEHR